MSGHGCANDMCASARGAGAVSKEKPVQIAGDVVTLTPAAAEKVKELMKREGKKDMGLRVAVQPGGCAGYTYGLMFDEKSDDEDVVIKAHGVKVFVVKAHAPILQGTVIDYVDSLQGAGFTMKNPNVTEGCGCGHSFGV